MVTFEKGKRILQAGGKKVSDEKVRQIMDELYKFASIIDDVKMIKDEKP
ncbi:hypothetical protein [Polaribacter sp. Hel1_85]|nr:hypothetical protein [Polaribacter sp. Hel1_85]KGL61926.1 hypothetical protein PHEL85_1712 [Polaribacter sp. Hel1_85]